MTKALRNPKARLALLAVLVLGGAYFLMRGRSSASTDPTAGLPVDPTGGSGAAVGTGATDPGGMTTGIGDTGVAGDTSGLAQAFQDFAASVNDRFGHFQDLENAYGQLKAGGDPFGSIPIDTGPIDTGASNPTGDGTAGGDGSPAAPGNAAATAKAKGFWWGGKFWRPGQKTAFQAWERAHGGKTNDTFYAQHPAIEDVFGLAHIPPPPPRNSAGAPTRPATPKGHVQPAPVAPKKKKKKKAVAKPRGGAVSRTTTTSSGARVTTVAQSSSSSYALSPYALSGAGGGSSYGGSYGGGGAARSVAVPGGGGGYVRPGPAPFQLPPPPGGYTLTPTVRGNVRLAI